MARFELDDLYLSLVRNGSPRAGPPRTEGRAPVTGKPPTEREPQPVVLWPGWFWWRGVNGQLYARRPKSSPPWVVRAHNFTALLGRIKATEDKHNK